jgi:rod shape-determining protein MreB
MDDSVAFIGMDLGTFKTNIVGSNGRREVLHTVVGWPKDHVARAMLGRDILYGKDCFEQRLALNVVRPFAKGALKYNEHTASGEGDTSLEKQKEAARLLVKQAVSLSKPPEGVPLYGVIGAPSRATVGNKQILMDAVRDTFDAVLIVPEPFCVAYGMNRLKDVLVVDIGGGTIDICPMYGTFPKDEDQITIPLGGDAVDEAFYNGLKQAYPDARLSENMARQIKEKHGFVHDLNEKALVTLPTEKGTREFDVTEPLKAACKTIVAPIIDGLRELIGRFDPEFQQPLLDNIILGGGGSQMKGLDLLIEDALGPYGGGSVTKVYDSVFAGAVGALKLAMGMPPEYWNRIKGLKKENGEKLQAAA